MFVAGRYFCPGLVFTIKAWSLPVGFSTLKEGSLPYSNIRKSIYCLCDKHVSLLNGREGKAKTSFITFCNWLSVQHATLKLKLVDTKSYQSPLVNYIIHSHFFQKILKHQKVFIIILLVYLLKL